MINMSPENSIALKVWWAFIWRLFVFGCLGGLAVGAMMSLLAHVFALPMQTANMIGYPFTLALYVFIGVHVAKRLMTKGFGQYRLTVVPRV